MITLFERYPETIGRGRILRVFRTIPGASVSSADEANRAKESAGKCGQLVRLVTARTDSARRSERPQFMPHAAVAVIARRRLVGQIYARAGAPQIHMLIAPIGCGKTTLLIELAERARQDGRLVGWLALSARHNEPEALSAALAQAADCGKAQAASSDDDRAARAHMAARHILTAASEKPPLALFLDNLEELRHPACCAVLEQVIHSWPAGHLLFCAGRALRGIRVGQALMDAKAAMIGPAELALDPLELAALAHELGDGQEPPFNVESVGSITNGWVVGVRALLMSKMRAAFGSMNVPAMLETYFEERICAALQVEQARNLMELATLEVFNATLCSQLPHRSISWRDFEELRDAGVYFERVNPSWGGAVPWYRLHPLLSEFLVFRYRRFDSRRVSELHRFAAEWFAHEGLHNQGARHAFHCRDTSRPYPKQTTVRPAPGCTGGVSGDFKLTSREREILGLVVEGFSSKEIAQRLLVSESTVKTHRKKAYMKLGVSRRSQAIAIARRKG